jgi:hypothetical protein
LWGLNNLQKYNPQTKERRKKEKRAREEKLNMMCKRVE